MSKIVLKMYRGGAAAIAAALLASGPALANKNISPPQEKFAISPGGVDMRSGRYVYEQTDLAIGGEGGLALTRQMVQQVVGHNNPFGNFSHNWDILLTEKRINIHDGIFKHVNGPDFQIEINFGGLSETFRAQAGDSGFNQLSRSGYKKLQASGDKAAATTVYTLTTADGTIAVFRPIGSNDCSSVLRCAYVSQITQANGTQLSFEYDNPGNNATRLRSVTSSRGYALLFEYNGGGLIERACVLNLSLVAKPADNNCPATLHAAASYAYSGTRMVSATDAASRAWGFTYTGGMGFVRPGENFPWLVNSYMIENNNDGLPQEIILFQQFADGTSYGYSYDRTPLTEGETQQVMGGAYFDRQGNVTQVRYAVIQHPRPQGGYGDVSDGSGGVDSSVIIWQNTPGPALVVDPLGRETFTDYCDPTTGSLQPGRCVLLPVPKSVTDPEGIRTEFTWDLALRTLTKSVQVARNNSPLAPIVREATYICTPAVFRACDKPTSVKDPREHVTTFEYAPEHGGVVKETGPAVAVRQPGGGTAMVSPEVRTRYEQRSAWTVSGSTYAAQPPIWVPVETISCRTSDLSDTAPYTCAVAGDEIRTLFEYGPNNGPNTLLVRGQAVTADGVTLRTCYAYDALGRKISETLPKGTVNWGACP